MQTRSSGWLAWALWVLTLLALAMTAWLDHLLRLSGRPALTWAQAGGAPYGVTAISAATVGAVVASRRPSHPVGWLLLGLGPKSLASVRVVPMCDQVRQAIARQLTGGARPEDLVVPGPGGSNGIPRGARAPLSTTNLRRVYKAAVEAAGAELGHVDLRGPHDLRHTFATWLEEAAIPSRVIDELMGHAGGRRDPGTGGSPMGRVYRETTPAMVARVTAALDERLGRALTVAAYLLRERRDSGVVDGGEGR